MEVFTCNPAEERWHWFTLPEGDGAELYLYMPDTVELDRLRIKFLKPGREDIGKMQDFVAEKWFSDFRYMTAGGKEIENTPENRRLILRHPIVWQFVQEAMLRAGAIVTEGNADGGSA